MAADPSAWILPAWTDYRASQDKIVDYLLYICDSDSELQHFVKSQAHEAIQAHLDSPEQALKDVIPPSKLVISEDVEVCAVLPSIWAPVHEEGSLNTGTPSLMTMSAYAVEPHLPAATAEPRTEVRLAEELLLVDKVLPDATSQDCMITATNGKSQPGTSPETLMTLFTNLMKEDEEPEGQRELTLLKQIMDKPDNSVAEAHKLQGNVQEEICASEQVPEPADDGSTLIYSVQGERRMTQLEVVKFLSDKFGIVGGRDFNFLYGPTTLGRPYIKGYAIVNFLDPSKAMEVVALGGGWSWAKFQGFKKNTERFLKRHGRVRSEKFRPLVWTCADDANPTCLRDPYDAVSGNPEHATEDCAKAVQPVTAVSGAGTGSKQQSRRAARRQLGSRSHET